MAVPLTRGRPYYATFTTGSALTPVEDGTITGLNIGAKYSFIGGNSVIVNGFFNSSIRFEAIVTSYDSSTGALDLGSITNITGFPSAITKFNISLAGQRGSKILHGSGTPSGGRIGDMFIDDTTGEVYIKS